MKLNEKDLWQLRYLQLATHYAEENYKRQAAEGQEFMAQLKRRYKLGEQDQVDIATGDIKRSP